MNKRILPAFLSCQGYRLTDDEKRLFAKYNPLGVCLFAKCCQNIANKEQVAALTKEIKECIGRADVLIATDQEGGRVRRLLEPEFTAVTAQENLTSEEMVRLHATLISSDFRKCGINVNFAPVLDIMQPDTSNVLFGRCFVKDHAKLGLDMVNEYIKHGICPCIKHLPGHGRATVDPHLSLPVIEQNLSELESDFAPFKAVHQAPMGMAAHILLKTVDDQNPLTFSVKAIDEIIRKEIGFNGFLVSDALVMKALKGNLAERAKWAISAGCDAVCLGNANFEANKEICESNIEITDIASERLRKICAIISSSADFANYEKVKNKYCEITKNIISYNYNYDATEVLNRLR